MKQTLIIITFFISSFICIAQESKGDWAQFKRYSEANASVTTKPVAVLMGDSITDNWSNRYDPDFFSENNLLGRGISGQTTSEMLVRFRQDVLDLQPKYVYIMAGTNDIAMNNGVISLEHVVGNIKSMCELAKAHKIKPVICSVLPSSGFRWRKEITAPQPIIMELNEMLKAYAREAKLKYLDYHSALKDETNGLPAKYSKDGTHPNIEAYKIMEAILLDSLR